MDDYENMSISEMQRLAAQGDTDVMRKLAMTYLQGNGANENLDKALELIMEAAECGNVEAMAETADIYRKIEKFETAFDWEKKAAEQGRVASQYNLGHHYDKGIGTMQNEQQAFYWFKKSAENGYTDAKHSLAVCYLTGKGTSQNMAQGIYWLEQASNDGHAAAKKRLGAAYIEGIGVPADEEKGISLLREAADLGDEEAKNALIEDSDDASCNNESDYSGNNLSSSNGKSNKTPNVIIDFFITLVKIILFSIRDAFVFWWKITIRDFDFFRNNREAPMWSRIGCMR